MTRTMGDHASMPTGPHRVSPVGLLLRRPSSLAAIPSACGVGNDRQRHGVVWSARRWRPFGNRVDRSDAEPDHWLRPGITRLRPLLRLDAVEAPQGDGIAVVAGSLRPGRVTRRAGSQHRVPGPLGFRHTCRFPVGTWRRVHPFSAARTMRRRRGSGGSRSHLCDAHHAGQFLDREMIWE